MCKSALQDGSSQTVADKHQYSPQPTPKANPSSIPNATSNAMLNNHLNINAVPNTIPSTTPQLQPTMQLAMPLPTPHPKTHQLTPHRHYLVTTPHTTTNTTFKAVPQIPQWYIISNATPSAMQQEPPQMPFQSHTPDTTPNSIAKVTSNVTPQTQAAVALHIPLPHSQYNSQMPLLMPRPKKHNTIPNATLNTLFKCSIPLHQHNLPMPYLEYRPQTIPKAIPNTLPQIQHAMPLAQPFPTITLAPHPREASQIHKPQHPPNKYCSGYPPRITTTIPSFLSPNWMSLVQQPTGAKNISASQPLQ